MRILYFLQDSVTKQYYIDAGLGLGTFNDAVIHNTERSVVSGMKKRCTSYRGDIKRYADGVGWKDEYAAAETRIKLPNCGIIIKKLKADERNTIELEINK